MGERIWQTKMLDTRAILGVLAKKPGVWHCHWPDPHSMPRVNDPTHMDAPEKVLRAKLRKMLKRGLVDGCDCGCRGDWVITAAGMARLTDGPTHE